MLKNRDAECRASNTRCPSISSSRPKVLVPAISRRHNLPYEALSDTHNRDKVGNRRPCGIGVPGPRSVMVNVPLALIGGVVALYVTHFHLSVSAAVGFIALFGIAVQNGVIMVSYFEQLRSEGVGRRWSIIEGSVVRLRPVLMTAILASIGLIPAAISTGIGSDVQKPLAIVIIGGLCIQPVLTLFVLPVMYSLFARPEVVLQTEPELA
jgi:hypothetical protein